MLEIRSNGSKWFGQSPAPLEELYQTLTEHTLDPAFEMYGNFLNRAPQWISEGATQKYTGCASIFGNFLTYSHAFDLVTDEKEIIDEIEHLVAENKATDRYIDAKNTMVKNLWTEFGDVPMDPETECLDAKWRYFPAGTHREEIWHWFEDTFNVRVADLMYGTN